METCGPRRARAPPTRRCVYLLTMTAPPGPRERRPSASNAGVAGTAARERRPSVSDTGVAIAPGSACADALAGSLALTPPGRVPVLPLLAVALNVFGGAQAAMGLRDAVRVMRISTTGVDGLADALTPFLWAAYATSVLVSAAVVWRGFDARRQFEGRPPLASAARAGCAGERVCLVLGVAATSALELLTLGVLLLLVALLVLAALASGFKSVSAGGLCATLTSLLQSKDVARMKGLKRGQLIRALARPTERPAACRTEALLQSLGLADACDLAALGVRRTVTLVNRSPLSLGIDWRDYSVEPTCDAVDGFVQSSGALCALPPADDATGLATNATLAYEKLARRADALCGYIDDLKPAESTLLFAVVVLLTAAFLARHAWVSYQRFSALWSRRGVRFIPSFAILGGVAAAVSGAFAVSSMGSVAHVVELRSAKPDGYARGLSVAFWASYLLSLLVCVCVACRGVVERQRFYGRPVLGGSCSARPTDANRAAGLAAGGPDDRAAASLGTPAWPPPPISRASSREDLRTFAYGALRQLAAVLVGLCTIAQLVAFTCLAALSAVGSGLEQMGSGLCETLRGVLYKPRVGELLNGVDSGALDACAIYARVGELGPLRICELAAFGISKAVELVNRPPLSAAIDASEYSIDPTCATIRRLLSNLPAHCSGGGAGAADAAEDAVANISAAVSQLRGRADGLCGFIDDLKPAESSLLPASLALLAAAALVRACWVHYITLHQVVNMREGGRTGLLTSSTTSDAPHTAPARLQGREVQVAADRGDGRRAQRKGRRRRHPSAPCRLEQAREDGRPAAGAGGHRSRRVRRRGHDRGAHRVRARRRRHATHPLHRGPRRRREGALRAQCAGVVRAAHGRLPGPRGRGAPAAQVEG